MASFFQRLLSFFFESDNNVNAAMKTYMQDFHPIPVEKEWREQFPKATDAEINTLAARCREIEDYATARGEEVRDYKLTPPDAIKMIGKKFPELNDEVRLAAFQFGTGIAFNRRFNAVMKMYLERRTLSFAACWHEIFPQLINLNVNDDAMIKAWEERLKEIEDYARARGKEVLDNKIGQPEASRMIAKKFPELNDDVRESWVARGLDAAK
jgi:hypothetical protein